MENNVKNKRSAERLSFLCECRIEYDGATSGSITARISDLSDGGAFIDTMTWLPVGSRLNLRFRLLTTEVSVGCEVRFFMPMIGMGVKFLNLSPEGLSLIQQVLYGGAAAGGNQRDSKQSANQADLAAGEPIISGNLSIISILDVIHIIERGALTGALAVKTDEVRGQIFFNDGLIVNAKARGTSGIPALKKLLISDGGSFEFHLSERRFEAAIGTLNNTALVLDLLVAQDQASIGLQGAPSYVVDSSRSARSW
jgi:hypothetical protein